MRTTRAGNTRILLRSDLKGLGLGWELMRLMIEWARAEGLRAVEGQVLRENTTMLAMCRSLGFSIREDPDDPEMRLVTLPVAAIDSGLRDGGAGHETARLRAGPLHGMEANAANSRRPSSQGSVSGLPDAAFERGLGVRLKRAHSAGYPSTSPICFCA